MKTYHNHRAEPYFTFLKNGRKTIEGRIKKGWYKNAESGDHIIVYNEEETDSIEVEIKRVTSYLNIEDMLRAEELKKMLPDVQNIKEGIKIYRKFYTSEKEEKFGMVAIEVKLL